MPSISHNRFSVMTFTAENIFFLGAVLIFASIVISKWGYRFGVPTLLLFLFTGMLFGSDGLGLEFNSHEDAQLIDVLELEETLAVVRVLEEGWGGTIDFTDVLLLLKIDGEWKCVAKAYNQNSNTISK